MSHALKITEGEAFLVDWLLTAHSWDGGLIEELQGGEGASIRQKIALGVVKGCESSIVLTKEEFSLLLVIVPIRFEFSGIDVGYSLKKKLLSFLLPIEINWGILEEVKDEAGRDDAKSCEGDSEGKAVDSS